MAHIWSIAPLFVVIVISLWSKQVLVGLAAGLIVGAEMLAPGILPMLNTTLAYLYKEVLDPNNLHLLVFLYLFGVLLGLLRDSGGIQGFVSWLEPWTKTRRRLYSVLWLSSLWTVMAPDFRILAMGPLLTRKLAKDPKELEMAGVILTATATPLAVLLPLGTVFVGYMVGLCAIAAKNSHYAGSGFTLFLSTLPFNFFAVTILLWSLWRSFFGGGKNVDRQSVAKHHARLAMQGEWGEIGSSVTSLPQTGLALNFVLPILLLWVLTLIFTYLDGAKVSRQLLSALLHADAAKSMMLALVATLVVTIPFLKLRGQNIAKQIQSALSGGNDMMSVLLLLILVWAVTGVSDALGFGSWVHAVLGSPLVGKFLVPLLFLAGAILSYFLGSTLGVWGLLMPIALSFSTNAGNNLVLTLAAVFAGGTFGGFASPLSDNTATLALVLEKPVMELAKILLKPALITGGAALILFTLVQFI